MKYTSAALALSAVFVAALASTPMRAGAEGSAAWDAKAAASYLDARQAWWQSWPNAARDHDTTCVSCHSALPYALARPALYSRLNEHGPSPSEARLLANVVKRVRAWKDMEPWYPDQTRGLPKTAESRGTESVINAIVLSRRDAAAGTLSADGRLALSNMWAQQMRTGDLSGGWAWLSFKLEPWEGSKSAYFGASLAAVAVGSAPGGYASSSEIEKNVGLLREYLPILIFLGVAAGLALLMVVASFVAARQRPDPEKLSAYECGFEAFDDARRRFDVRYYLVAILFIIFDLEVAFLFPWAVSLGDIGVFGFWSMIVFLGVLTVGFAYEWRKGALEWE